MAKVSIGSFFRRINNTNGTIGKETQLFLPKTLAKLVFLAGGRSVDSAVNEHDAAITRLDTRLNNMSVFTKEYESMEAYRAALAEGSAQPDGLYIVNIDV